METPNLVLAYDHRRNSKHSRKSIYVPSAQNCPKNIPVARKIARQITKFSSVGGGGASPSYPQELRPCAAVCIDKAHNEHSLHLKTDAKLKLEAVVIKQEMTTWEWVTRQLSQFPLAEPHYRSEH